MTTLRKDETKKTGTPLGGRMLERLVAAVIYDNTQPASAPSEEATRSLFKYLSNPNTKDLVYEKMIERVQSLKTGTAPVLALAIKLLKAHLPHHVPNIKTLEKLDQFCINMGVEHTPASTMGKSLHFIRKIIKHKIRAITGEGATPPGIRKATLSSSSRTTSSKSLASPLEDVSVNGNADSNLLIPNFLSYTTAAETKSGNLSFDVDTLEAVPIFCGGLSTPDATEDLAIINPKTVKEHVDIVSHAKKKEERRLYAQAGLASVRRKGVTLFQYKYYSEQLPLSLSNEEMELLVDTITNPPDDDHQSCLIASKIIIKLLVDMYVSDSAAASRIMLSLLFEMLGSSQTYTRVHAFNLLLNLSVHMNLLEEVSSLEDTGSSNMGSYKRIQIIQEELFCVLKEMLLWIFHKEVKDEKVWQAGLNCMLFFVTSSGNVDKKKLISMDARLIPAFLANIENLSNEVYKQLIRMFVNIVMMHKTRLDGKFLQRLCPGGASWLIRIYSTTRSMEVRENLFVVLYQIVLNKLQRSHKPKAIVILEFLHAIEAPHFFPQLFLLPTLDFNSEFMAFVKKAPREALAKISLGLLEKITAAFLRLARKQHKLKEEFAVQRDKMMKEGSNVYGLYVKTLLDLINSEAVEDRRHGEAWLFSLLKKDDGSKTASVVSKAENTLTSLLSAKQPYVRWIYLSITQKLILHTKYKKKAHEQEQTIASVFKLLNEKLSRVVAAQETNPTNLLFMMDIILDLVALRTDSRTSNATKLLYDDKYTLFLEGRMIISNSLLKLVNMNVLVHLLSNLPRTEGLSEARVVALVMLVHRCKDDLESIGGVTFFKKLLLDTNPQIAFHASRFLIEQLQRERKEQYQAIFSQLLAKAQETNDDKLLSNYYLQVLAIVEMNTQHQNKQKNPSAPPPQAGGGGAPGGGSSLLSSARKN